jgi:intein/homing endonuclease
MLKNSSKYAVFASRDGGRQIQTRASLTGAGGSVPTSSGGGFSSTASATQGVYNKPILDGFVAHESDITMRAMYRDIYMHDPIAGSAVDLQAQLPFSDFTLSGLPSQDMLRTYAKSLEAIHVKTLLPELAVDYQVEGQFIGYANFDDSEKRITSIMPQNMDHCEITELPIYGRDPIIDVKMPDSVKKLLSKNDPRVTEVFNKYGDDLKDMAKKGKFPLDPRFTIFIARRTFTTTTLGTSYYRRIVPIWLWEKALLRGTIDLSYRRQKSILHLMVGDEEWEPNNSELTQLVNMFIQADVDPTGAIVATRPGISTQEIRNGSDFWRYDEIYDFACFTGKTLVPTSQGLLQMDEIGDANGASEQTINSTVSGDLGPAKATKFLVRGEKSVARIDMENGAQNIVTPSHRFLVFEPKLNRMVWRRTAHIEPGTMLCFNTNKLVRTTPLNLSLTKEAAYQTAKPITLPTQMTPELAFVLGLLVAEGDFSGDSVRFTNSNRMLLTKFERYVQTIFGLDTNISLASAKGSTWHIKGRSGVSKVNTYSARVHSRALVKVLQELGLTNERKDGKSPCLSKVLPWSIRRADEQSQLAYLAAYIEGGGHITRQHGVVGIASGSPENLRVMQSVLATHGFYSVVKGNRLTLNPVDGHKLLDALSPYMINKRRRSAVFLTNRKRGVPTAGLRQFIKQRMVRVNYRDIRFVNDLGEIVQIPSWGKISGNVLNAAILPWDSYKQGKYDSFIAALRLISNKEADYLERMFNAQYTFIKVKKVTALKKKVPVYDLTISDDHHPAFVANGVVAHNSSAKMRALGISDAFLSGDATYSNMETSLSVFLEQIRSFRDLITRKIFYQKLFPLIAIENNFGITDKPTQTTGGLRDPRIQTRTDRNGKKQYSAVIGQTNLLTMADEEVDITKFHMPKLHWHKALKPEADSAYIEMLGQLSDRGLPIPLRIWAAAGGLPITDIMQSLDEDVRIRKKVDKYKKSLPKAPEEEAQQMFSGAGLNEVIAAANKRINGKRNRQFDELEMRDPQTRKTLSRKGRIVLEERSDKVAARVLANLASKENNKEQEAAQASRKRTYSIPSAKPEQIRSRPIFGNTAG